MTNQTKDTAACTMRTRSKAGAAMWLASMVTAGIALSAASLAQVAPPPAATASPVATPAPAAQEVQAPAPQKAPGPVLTPATADGKISVARLSRAAPLDRRMQVLAKELKLDGKQQAQIRQILEAQRDAVRRIWADPAVLPPERTAATQAQAEQAGDAIRAVLNDEQQKLYNRSRAENALPPGEKRSVEQWMDAAKAKPPAIP